MSQERCAGCGRAFVEITLDVGGRAMTMKSCSACDIRRWYGPDGSLALDGVLADIASTTGRR